jgi:hypothetical protein
MLRSKSLRIQQLSLKGRVGTKMDTEIELPLCNCEDCITLRALKSYPDLRPAAAKPPLPKVLTSWLKTTLIQLRSEQHESGQL